MEDNRQSIAPASPSGNAMSSGAKESLDPKLDPNLEEREFLEFSAGGNPGGPDFTRLSVGAQNCTEKGVKETLGGGNSNIFYFHPDYWGNDPI